MWALLYIEQDPSYTPVNINIVCMVVVALEMLHVLTLGRISAIFIAHVRDALFSSYFTLHNTSVLLCSHTVCALQ